MKSQLQSGELPPQKNVVVAVVGENLSTALVLDAIQRATLAPHVKVQNFDVLRPRPLEAISDDHWIVWPESYGTQSMGPLAESIALTHQAFIFNQGTRRFRLHDFLHNRDAELGVVPVHFSLRRRILAAGLWNDVTPPVWEQRKRNLEPDVNWPQKIPQSWRDENWLQPRMIQRRDILKRLKARSTLPASGPKAFVMGVKDGGSEKGYQLVHNPPFEATKADVLIWTDRSFDLFLDAELKSKVIRSFPQKSVGHWRSYLAHVDRNLVAGLPYFSLWLGKGSAQHLMLTGELRSGSICRVICAPSEEAAKVTLQIQHLMINHDDAPDLLIETPDKILHELCPHLEQAKVKYQSYVADEDLIYASPLSGYCLAARDLHCWRSRSVVKHLEFFDKIAARFKNKSPRPSLSANNPT